jgi:HD superfamily phosphodiesterase
MYTDSISTVRSFYDNFYDIIHNFEHSERVAANAKLIADSIGYDDKDFLELCALWHDAARTKGVTDGHEEEGALLAKNDMLQRGADRNLAERAYEAIRFHKSSANPMTIEGKIIRDADKLDIFTVKRWQNCAEAGWIPEYVDDLRKTVAAMDKYPDAFTYDYTKEQFKARSIDFLNYYNSIKDQLQ